MKRVRALPFLVASLAVTGCGIGYQNASREQRPEVITGMGATVMYPGESGPAMPGSSIGPAGGASSSTGSTAPGTHSGSSTSGGQPASSTGGGPPAAGGGTADGSNPPSGKNMTMISGGKEDVSESFEDKRFLPIGPLFGYPFWFLGQKIGDKADEAAEGRMEGKPQESAVAPRANTPDDVERNRLAQENAALRDQLQQRANAAPPVQSAAPQRTGGAGIGAELAALERTLGKRGGATSTPSVTAGPPASRPLVSGAERLGAPVETDRDGDGRADLWTYARDGRPTLEALDEDHDGRVDRNLHYDDRGRLVSSDEDTNGDGILETTSRFEDGRLARRRSDSDGDGQADTWTFHRGDELLRSEIDKNGDGFRDAITIYDAGRVAREEEDRNGDGRPDVVALYLNGQISEKREDFDFDGKPDVVSRYQNGKLASREADSSEVFEQWEREGAR